MKPFALMLMIIGICCFCLQCSTFHSQDVADNSSRVRPSSESLEIDSEWRVQVTHVDVEPKTQWSASCTSRGDCWYWSSSKLFAPTAENPKEISVRRQENEFILDASPISSERGWVVTSAGLFRVSNSGADWTSVAVPGFGPQQGRIHAVHFTDDKHGWITGGVYRPLTENESAPNNARSDDRKQVLVGAIAKTTDGGLSWETKRFDQSVGRFSGIVFSQRVGLVSGDAGLVSTSNGGETWNDTFPKLGLGRIGDRPQISAMFVLDERRGWLSVSGANILRTEDGLRTWKPLSASAELKDDAPPFSELAFLDDRRGLAVLSELGVRRVYKTNDGGTTWTAVNINRNLSGLAVVAGSNRIIAVGEGGLYSFSPP
jgi:photosystem II stability/assembly factor-like uncharacterized protein